MKMLWVDDTIEVIWMVQRFFRMCRWEVAVADSCKTALDLFCATPDAFDVVVTDYQMPDGTGVQLVKWLRMVRPNVRIIMCTGSGLVMTQAELKELGISQLVEKPFNLSKTAEIIRGLVGLPSSPLPGYNQQPESRMAGVTQ